MMPHPEIPVPYALTPKAEAYLARPEPDLAASQDEPEAGS